MAGDAFCTFAAGRKDRRYWVKSKPKRVLLKAGNLSQPSQIFFTLVKFGLSQLKQTDSFVAILVKI